VRPGLPRLLFLSGSLLVFATISSAQTQPPTSTTVVVKKAPPPSAPDYSNEGSVLEQDRTSFKFENDGSGEEIQYARIRIQSPQALQTWGQLVFTYSAVSDKISADFVRVHKPDGHVVTAGPDAVQDLSSPVERVAPTYTDIRQMHITVPDLNVGDTLEYQIHSVTVQPLVPGQFFTQWNASKQIITLDETFEVNLPRARQLHVKTSNGIAAPNIQDQGDRRIYTWHSSLTKHPDDSSDDDKKKKKQKEPELPDVQISTFTNWEQLGQWYADLQKPRAAVSDSVRAKADELVKGFSTPADKATAIYDYVSKNVRYVSLSFGLGRYQPHSATDVLSNQYGDCKDKATLLEALLAAENIESYPVLINFQHKIDPDMPSPGQFDHLINIVVLDGKAHWADTTPGVTPFGFLLSPLRDKQALSIPPAAPAALQKTPMDPPFTPATTISVDGQVDSFGRFQGKFSISDNGEFAVIIRSALRIVPQNQWPQMADGMAQALLGNKTAKTTSPHFANAEDLDQPLVFDAQFSEPNFLDLSRKDIDLGVPSAVMNANDVDQPDKDTTEPLEIGTIQNDNEIWKINLLSQPTATLPVPVHVTRDYADYESTYSSAAATVTVERHLSLRNSQLAPSRYNDWEAFRNTVLGDTNQKIELANASPASTAIPTGASADDLYDAAMDAERSRNYAYAAQLFAAAAAKDPDRDNVWNALGHAYNEMQNYADAVPALQQAIAKNAYDAYAYNNLGQAYRGLGRYDDAIKEYLKQIEINPLDQYAHANLASVYLQQRKYDTAQKEYQTALKITPNNFNLNIGLGTADLGLHQDDAALAAFHIALEKIPDPSTWNNVAFYLADNNSHLDLAEQYSENSIHAVEAQLVAASLDTVGPTQAALVQTIATFWDTMGWIKFKQANLPAAESYIRAAWLLSDDATIGDHLGQIYQKEGRRDDAIHAYALALTYPNPPVETRGRLIALVGEKRAATEISFAHASQRRSISLPNPQKIDASADFWVLLSFPAGAGGAAPSAPSVDAKFIAIDENPKNKLHPNPADKDADEKTTDKLRDTFGDYTATLRAAKFPYSFPQGEPGKILLRGFLACDTIGQPSCAFIPFPAEQTVRLSLVASGLGSPQ
jgi:tetratricopeptide (TPR) repeat protein